MKVLSLFDGMSCGQIALKQLGVIPEVYYASEIDKYAIKQTQINFPSTIQLGDVTNWKDWNINWGEIDLLLAGSPCQGFSLSGKQLAFDDPRSKLFFVFIDILNHIKSLKSDVLFMLENVNMKRSHMRIISEFCGVFPVNINSNLVSAQNRDRWYWTNIRTKEIGLFGEVYSDIPQPKDRKIFLRDILEKDVDERYFLKDNTVRKLMEYSERNKNNGNGFGFNPKEKGEKMNALTVGGKGKDDLVIVEQRKNIQQLEPRRDGKTNCLTTVQKDNMVISGSLVGFNGMSFREIKSGKSCTLLARGRNDGSGQPCVSDEQTIRRLTPTECARLQTVPDWYKWECSDTQQYKMLGNGWTVEVIAHILKFIL